MSSRRTDSVTQERRQHPRGLEHLWDTLKEVTFGLTGYEFVKHATHIRADMENLFLLVTLGDLIGIPVLPPYYSLRLLPFIVPQVASWKRRVLRPKEFWEKGEYDLLQM